MTIKMLHRCLRLVPLLITAWSILALTLSAQVNTEAMRVVSDLVGYKASLSVSGQLRGGNKELTSVQSAARAEYRNRRHVWFAVGTFKFLKPGSNVHLNAGFAHARYNYRISNVVSFELLGQMEYDVARLLERRILAGTGLRIRLIQQKEAHLYWGITPVFESELLDKEKVKDEDPLSTIARLSNFLVLRLPFGKGVTFVSTTYLQPRVDDINDSRILEEAALAFTVTERLSFNSTFYFRFDSRPPSLLKRTDYTLTTGLSLSL